VQKPVSAAARHSDFEAALSRSQQCNVGFKALRYLAFLEVEVKYQYFVVGG